MKSKAEEEQKKYKEMDEGGEDTYDYGDSEAAVDTGAPKVASSKGSKIAVIAFFAILISIVLYFAVFSGNKQPTQNGELQPVPAADFSVTTPTPEGNLEKFDDVFNKKDDPKEDVILETPDLPAIPELPNVFDDQKEGALPLFMDLPPEEQKNAQNQQNGANNANNGGIGNGSTNNSANQNQNVPEPPVVQPPPAPSPIIVVSGSPGPKTSVGYENNIVNLNKDPITSLTERVPSITAQYIKDRTVTLIQGKILTAILETAINTDFPGDVRGIISRDVYAESGTNILIPKGSRVYGTYSSTVTRGQARVTINWTRIIRPDGVDATIAFNAADQFGRSGIEGDVDNKYSAVIANSILTTVLAIGGVIAAEKLSNNGGSNTTTTNAVNSTTTTSGSPSGQAIYDISKTVIDTVGSAVNNALNLNPTIRVPQGTKITIIVNNDMSLPQFKK